MLLIYCKKAHRQKPVIANPMNRKRDYKDWKPCSKAYFKLSPLETITKGICFFPNRKDSLSGLTSPPKLDGSTITATGRRFRNVNSSIATSTVSSVEQVINTTMLP